MQRVPYPASALEAGITGDVTARFEVGRDGRVGTIRILESSPQSVFDDAVVYGPLDVLPRKVEHVKPQLDPMLEGWGWPLMRTPVGIDGYPVEVTFTIDRRGAVGFVSHGMLSRHLPDGWADEVIRAVRAWRYLPAIRDGRSVPATMTLSFLIQEPTE